MLFKCQFCDSLFQWKRSKRSTSGFALFKSLPMNCLAVIVVTVSSTRRRNEIIMSFCAWKLPPGSSFSCKYCDTKISLHNHSSFIHHEKHCLLNPSVSATCAVLHKHHSNGKFIDAEAMRTTSKRAKLRNAPLCMCAVDPERCLQMWSTSEGYRRKMYYCCSKFDKEDRCKFFKWCD